MSKLGFSMTSLVAAVPGAFLCYLMVATFLTGFEDMNGKFKALSIFTLILALGVTLIPIAILVFYKPPAAAKAQTKSKAGASGTVDSEEEIEAGESWGESGEFDAADGSTSEFDSFSDEDLSDDEVAEFEDDDDFDDDEVSDELSDEFSFEDEFEDEEDEDF